MAKSVKSMKKIYTYILCAILISISGCSSAVTTELTPEQLYSDNHSIDMFVYEGAAYVNASDIDWVKNKTLEKEKYIGKITNSGITSDFKSWDSTVLPTQTEIYESDNPQILLARLGENYIPYLIYVEG